MDTNCRRTPLELEAETEEQVHPLLIDVVLDKTFRYLSTNDLYNCRLVSRMWSSIGMGIIGSRGKLVELDCRSIGPHVQFLSEQPTPTFIANYDVVFPDYCTENGIKEIVNGVGKLVGYFGRTCIQSLTYHHYENKTEWSQNNDLYRFLNLVKLVSPGLKVLRFNNNGQFPASLSSIESTLANISLPELNTFCYHGFTEKDNNTSTNIIGGIINGSPKLQALMLYGDIKRAIFDEESMVRLMNKLSNSDTVSHIQELHIKLGDPTNCQALAQLQFQKLKKLTVYIHDGRFYESGNFNRKFTFVLQFLKRNSATLTSFDCHFDNEKPTSDVFLQILPTLPKLTHLGYHVKQHYRGAFSLPNFLQINNIDVNKFPSLNRVRTQIGALYCHAQTQSYDHKVHLDITDISVTDTDDIRSLVQIGWTTIDVKIDQNPSFTSLSGTENTPNMLADIKRLQELYPNIRQISIINEIEKMTTKNNDFLKQYVQAICEETNGLEQLQISNYDDDWLVGVLQESPQALQTLQRLRHLRIPPIERYINTSPSGLIYPRNLKKTMRQRKIVDLEASLDFVTLLEVLPNLRVFEFAENFALTGNMSSLYKQHSLQKQLRSLQARFPKVHVEFI